MTQSRQDGSVGHNGFHDGGFAPASTTTRYYTTHGGTFSPVRGQTIYIGARRPIAPPLLHRHAASGRMATRYGAVLQLPDGSRRYFAPYELIPRDLLLTADPSGLLFTTLSAPPGRPRPQGSPPEINLPQMIVQYGGVFMPLPPKSGLSAPQTVLQAGHPVPTTFLYGQNTASGLEVRSRGQVFLLSGSGQIASFAPRDVLPFSLIDIHSRQHTLQAPTRR